MADRPETRDAGAAGKDAGRRWPRARDPRTPPGGDRRPGIRVGCHGTATCEGIGRDVGARRGLPGEARARSRPRRWRSARSSGCDARSSACARPSASYGSTSSAASPTVSASPGERAAIDRDARAHRLERGQAEALVQRRVHERGRPVEELRELGLGLAAHALRLRRGAAREHERQRAAARQRAVAGVGVEQQRRGSCAARRRRRRGSARRGRPRRGAAPGRGRAARRRSSSLVERPSAPCASRLVVSRDADDGVGAARGAAVRERRVAPEGGREQVGQALEGEVVDGHDLGARRAQGERRQRVVQDVGARGARAGAAARPASSACRARGCERCPRRRPRAPAGARWRPRRPRPPRRAAPASGARRRRRSRWARAARTSCPAARAFRARRYFSAVTVHVV